MSQDAQADQNIAREINQLIEMPRGEFEELVAGLYRALGHQAMCVPANGERHVSVIVGARNGQKWIVQCRQWRGAVGEVVVREFYTLMRREHAAQGAIITTARFTPKAREWAKGKPIHLYDGIEFLKAMKRIREKANAD